MNESEPVRNRYVFYLVTQSNCLDRTFVKCEYCDNKMLPRTLAFFVLIWTQGKQGQGFVVLPRKITFTYSII